MEINNEIIIQRIEEIYRKYGVSTKFIESLNSEQKIKGMKGILAELDIKKEKEYSAEDLLFIRKVYAMFC